MIKQYKKEFNLWTRKELIILVANYGLVSLENLLEMLPNRTKRAIHAKANCMGLSGYKNEYRTIEDITEIYIVKNETKFTLLIDTEDIEKVFSIGKLCLHKEGYATGGYPKILLHRFIMDCPKDMVIDHINHNRLDNRKQNLRICTIAENNRNRLQQTEWEY